MRTFARPRRLPAALLAAALLAAPAAAAAPPAAHAPAAAPAAAARHLRPVPGAVLRPFDPPPRPWAAGHRGVDLAAPVGAPVRASAAGVVHFAGPVGGVPVVSVRHGPRLRTTYQPVAAVVRAGQPVARGQLIGHLAAGAEPGLHWGARVGAGYLNPLDLLGRRRIVLKPPVG